jgi:CRISPR-associated protein Cas1
MQRGKAPLVHNLQEPFRWMVDVTVISCLEKRMFTKKDFIITENYNLRLRPESAKKPTVELMKQFSTTINYGKYNFEWNYVIVKKAYELAQYLIGNKKSLDFSSPEPNLKRDDSGKLREKIKGLSYKKMEGHGI